MNKTVLKTKELLDLFLDCERLTLPEMVARLRMPKTSVYRMAQSLVALGFLQKQGDQYELGLSLLTFGALVAERLDIRRVALPVMERLKEETKEAVNLVIRDGDEALYIEKVETSEPVRVYTKVGRRAPLYAGACPRVLLAFMDEVDRERYLEQVELVKIAKCTVTDKQVLRRLVEEGRNQGYTVSCSELENYSAAVAVPIFNHEGAAVAGLSVAGPEPRFSPDDVVRIVPLLKQAAMDISRELGFQGKG
ncbi:MULTISPECIES: IclR family transcriptional regulator [Geobacillus]|jgi:IclR family KDG regulon transcriptional repressor|uniref:Transcriptional regulator (IclR family) n=4 Tax=Geobacillus thermodenitrificans TaxID=33940 RepID=A4IN16_GEOTN|nr:MULTISPECIES: IclR family transcriptional regulator [Geobacillus]ABO66720.1 Transcriptional regulator (IclR family) [Geobacillus thermodenitrificans NG80-2]ARA96920.1 IclR family transcriptional regulator [Geobacillus thermodenitrificans]ARP42477.1 Transcriptional regulator KdgR [Geobacillus thermodenitrificans]ATO36191.1 IclR family transcriptional regulator [Geobacillus thermodenitrificans]KQB93551.1 HTH-type transcriptional regulator KipR [Geobacillus sp. PA-3]